MKEQILKIIKEVKGELFDNPEYGEYPESELRLMNQVQAINAIEQKLSDFSRGCRSRMRSQRFLRVEKEILRPICFAT
jgi:hypothetical protein